MTSTNPATLLMDDLIIGLLLQACGLRRAELYRRAQLVARFHGARLLLPGGGFTRLHSEPPSRFSAEFK
jgi:hypothetical protein